MHDVYASTMMVIMYKNKANDKYVKYLRNNVKSVLTRNNMSQSDLARRMNVSTSEISNWLTGKTAIRFTRVCIIAEVLGLSPGQLFNSRE